MNVPVIFLKNLFDYAASQNMDRAVVKHLMANTDYDCNDPAKMVDASEYILVFQHFVETSESSYCGLRLGAYLNLNSLGLVLDISLSTSSINQGIYILRNFLKSRFPLVSCTIAKDSECHVLRLESSVENKEVRRELLHMVLYIVYRELKLMLPNGLTPKIGLPFSKTEDINLFFKEAVLYSSDHHITLPKNLEELEINVNRVKEIELLLPKFVSMLNQSDSSLKEFTKKVRDMALRMCNPEIPNFKEVQTQFAFSERTFQRKLAAEGTSFRRIINEIKEELSYYLSNEKHLKTKDIAYILGYSESSAYLHAVKAWKNELN